MIVIITSEDESLKRLTNCGHSDIPTQWTLPVPDAQTHTTANFAHANHREPHCTANDDDLCETESVKVPGEVVGVAVLIARDPPPRKHHRVSEALHTAPPDRIVPHDHGVQPAASPRVRGG